MATQRHNFITIKINRDFFKRGLGLFWAKNRKMKVVVILVSLASLTSAFIFENLRTATLLAGTQAILIEFLIALLVYTMGRKHTQPKKVQVKKKTKRRRVARSTTQEREVAPHIEQVQAALASVERELQSSARLNRRAAGKSKIKKLPPPWSRRTKLIIMDFDSKDES